MRLRGVLFALRVITLLVVLGSSVMCLCCVLVMLGGFLMMFFCHVV